MNKILVFSILTALLAPAAVAAAGDDTLPQPGPLFRRSPPRLNVVSISLGAGAACCTAGVDTAFPAMSFAFARNITDRFAIEGSLGSVRFDRRYGIDEVEVAGLFYLRPATRVSALVPFLRIGFGAASDDFTELTTYPKVRVGGGAEYAFPPTLSIPGLQRAGSTWGVRIEGTADLINASALDGRRVGGVGSLLRTNVALVHRF